MDNGEDAPKAFAAPQPQLFSSIIEGILGGKLEWGLVIIGALVAVALEMMGVSALPVAVGMYIPLSSTTPIFVGGILRYLCDRKTGAAASESEAETGPGVLLASGYIAGGTLCGLIVTFFAFLPDSFNRWLDVSRFFDATYLASDWPKIVSTLTFAGLALMLTVIGCQKMPSPIGERPLPV